MCGIKTKAELKACAQCSLNGDPSEFAVCSVHTYEHPHEIDCNCRKQSAIPNKT